MTRETHSSTKKTRFSNTFAVHWTKKFEKNISKKAYTILQGPSRSFLARSVGSITGFKRVRAIGERFIGLRRKKIKNVPIRDTTHLHTGRLRPEYPSIGFELVRSVFPSGSEKTGPVRLFAGIIHLFDHCRLFRGSQVPVCPHST